MTVFRRLFVPDNEYWSAKLIFFCKSEWSVNTSILVIESFVSELVAQYIHHGLPGSQYPDNKVHGANMGPTWVLSAPDGPHVSPMNLAIRVYSDIHHRGLLSKCKSNLHNTNSNELTKRCNMAPRVGFTNSSLQQNSETRNDILFRHHWFKSKMMH